MNHRIVFLDDSIDLRKENGTVKCRAFTLIELLIVVAIIAILAAIAIPNFLEAQSRTKVSRVKSDMRSIAVAIEAYTVDSSRPPIPKFTTGHYNYQNDSFVSYLKCPKQVWSGGCGYILTTPIAYITSIPDDVFAPERKYPSVEFVRYHWVYFVFIPQHHTNRGPGLYLPGNYFQPFRWYMISPGPDRIYWDQTDGRQMFYDPTNGIVSPGDIWMLDTVGLIGGGEK